MAAYTGVNKRVTSFKGFPKIGLWLIFAIGFIFAIGATWYVYRPSHWPIRIDNTLNSSDNLKLIDVLFNVYKSIVVGFVVGILGFLVPQYYKQARDNFEREREARRLFSCVETGVSYLPDRISVTGKMEEALKHLEELHVQKHELLVFKNDFIKNRDLGKYVESDKGLDGWSQKTYLRLRAIRLALRDFPEDWGAGSAKEKCAYLEDADSVALRLNDLANSENLDLCCVSSFYRSEELRYDEFKRWYKNAVLAFCDAHNKKDIISEWKGLSKTERANEVWESYKSAVEHQLHEHA